MKQEEKRTLIIGASDNKARYSYLAAHRLLSHNIPVVCIGLRPGQVGSVPIQTGFPELDKIDTVTLYIGPRHQPQFYDYLLALKPNRVIFNPGTENDELAGLLQAKGIHTLEACTLVMLSTGMY